MNMNVKMQELDLAATLIDLGIDIKWTGSLYKDVLCEWYLIIIPFPHFIAGGRGVTVKEAYKEALESVEHRNPAISSRYRIKALLEQAIDLCV